MALLNSVDFILLGTAWLLPSKITQAAELKPNWRQRGKEVNEEDISRVQVRDNKLMTLTMEKTSTPGDKRGGISGHLQDAS